MQPIEMHYDDDNSFTVGDEEYIYFTAGWDNAHGGEEMVVKRSRWETLGSPDPIYVIFASSVVTVDKITDGVVTLNELRDKS